MSELSTRRPSNVFQPTSSMLETPGFNSSEARRVQTRSWILTDVHCPTVREASDTKLCQEYQREHHLAGQSQDPAKTTR